MTASLPPSPFTNQPGFNARLVAVAVKELGVREEGGRNRGMRVEEYLASVNLPPGFAWCAAFVHWAAGQARLAGQANPCPRTGGVLHMWQLASPECVESDPAPGRIFILDTGTPGGAGHCGIVEVVNVDATIGTIEGNTNGAGSRDGDRVARHRWNPRDGKRGKLLGYIDLANALTMAG